MTALTPVNDTSSPYHKMTLPLDPTNGTPYAINPFTGKALPHANPSLTSQEAKFAAFHPQILKNMNILAQQQKRMAASQGGMPPASPLSPEAGAAPKVATAAKDAQVTPNPKAQKATTKHSFTVKVKGREVGIDLKESFTNHDAEGIAYVKKVSPSDW